MSGTPPDRLRQATLVFACLWVAAALALGVVVAGAMLRGPAASGSDPRPALVDSLGLTELTLSPSGRPPRLGAPPPVDLRHLPGQPRPPWASTAVAP